MQAGKALIGKSKCSRFFCSECGLMEAAQRMSPERTPVSFPLNPPGAAVGADVRRSLSRQCFQRGERTKVTGVLRMPVI